MPNMCVYAAVLAALPASADIIDGSITVIAPPAQTGNNNQQVNVLLGFNEQQNVTLGEDLVLGDVTLLAGTVVSSHSIIYDPPGGSASISGNAIFSDRVLAIITTRDDLIATDALFGAEGTQYNSPSARGLESNDSALLGDPNEVVVDFTAGSPGDAIRVLTIPAPAAGAAILGLAAFTRRR